jgi:hypothetical protein
MHIEPCLTKLSAVRSATGMRDAVLSVDVQRKSGNERTICAGLPASNPFRTCKPPNQGRQFRGSIPISTVNSALGCAIYRAIPAIVRMADHSGANRVNFLNVRALFRDFLSLPASNFICPSTRAPAQLGTFRGTGLRPNPACNQLRKTLRQIHLHRHGIPARAGIPYPGASEQGPGLGMALLDKVLKPIRCLVRLPA